MATYLTGIRNTIVVAVVATIIGCIIGLVCGILNTIPYTKQDSLGKRFVLKLIRVIVRIYVEVFRGTPMILQAVFIYYGLPYFIDGSYGLPRQLGHLAGLPHRGLHQHGRIYGRVRPGRHHLRGPRPDGRGPGHRHDTTCRP